MITPDKFVPTILPAMPEEMTGTCSWAWGCSPNVNVSWAQALTSMDQPVNNLTLPIVIPSFVPPSVVDMVYLCPMYRRKSWGNLLVSLFTGKSTLLTWERIV
jgi:hypothetical protein